MQKIITKMCELQLTGLNSTVVARMDTPGEYEYPGNKNHLDVDYVFYMSAVMMCYKSNIINNMPSRRKHNI